MEKVLNYSRSAVGSYDGVAQQRSWDCGPASAQIILQSAGVNVDEQTLIDKIGTNENGTNHAGLIAPVLDSYLPGSGYKSVWIGGPKPSPAQVKALWNNVKRSIDSGRGVILNFEAPPNNFPRGTRGSVSPNYRGWNSVYHYVACMGYAVDADGTMHFWIADPGFSPFGYWISLEQAALLIVPHAYAYAADAPAVVAPEPQPEPSEVDRLKKVLSDLLSLIEQYNPDLLKAYLNNMKVN